MKLFGQLFRPPEIQQLEARRNTKGLIEALASNDEQRRRQAVDALGRLKAPEAVDPLLGLFDAAADREMRKSILSALCGLGDARAARVFVDALASGDRELRPQAVAAFKTMRDPAATPLLLAALEETAGRAEDAAICDALANQGEDAVEGLAGLLDHPRGSVRARAQQVLRLLSSEKAGEALIGTLVRNLASESGHTRARAVSVLVTAVGSGYKPDGRVAKLLCRAICDPEVMKVEDEDKRGFPLNAYHQALKALAAAGEDGIAALSEMRQDASLDLESRRRVLWALADSEQEGAAQALTSALDDPDPEIRSEAAGHLLKKQPTSAVLEAVDRLRKNDRDAEVRQTAKKLLQAFWADPDLMARALLAGAGPEGPIDFKPFLANAAQLDPYQRKLFWGQAAEGLQKRMRHLASLQCYLELVGVDPVGSIGNAAWNSIKGAWGTWLASEACEIVQTFERLKAANYPRRRRPDDCAESAESLVDALRGIIGRPGEAPRPDLRIAEN
jgi:HEAT repeat protein